MILKTPYFFKTNAEKQAALWSFAFKDPFFEKIGHDLIDYGFRVNFSGLGGAGAYQPYALATEKLETPKKQQQFINAFWKRHESGDIKAEMHFPVLSSEAANMHVFLHEAMHFYQDMHGLYLLPLQEQGIFPVMLDMQSDITAYLFNEAWAQTEAIRTSWALKEKGDTRGWKGAVRSKDWRTLARSYDDDLQNGVDEAKAAFNIFHRWYLGEHRTFYENHALKVHTYNFARFQDGVENLEKSFISEQLRALELPMLIAKLPKGDIPKFFHHIDWSNEIYSRCASPNVGDKIQEFDALYGKTNNTNVQDIKCGSPPYLWNRLKQAEQKASEVPPPS